MACCRFCIATDSPRLKIDAEYVELVPPIGKTLPEDKHVAPLTTVLTASVRALVIPRPPRLLMRVCVANCCELLLEDASGLTCCDDEVVL